MLRKVAIYSSDDSPRTRGVILKLVNELCRRDVKIQLYDKSGDQDFCPGRNMIEKFSDLGTLSGLPDLVLSVGGDGTFLETMIRVKDLGIAVAGVNTGRLGFLSNISEEELVKSLDLLYRGEYTILERSLLEIAEPAGLFDKGTQLALNEITIQKADLSMITITVYVDETYLNTYWADGIIISTATGSTAYNLSAGGPILCPDDDSIIISPITPHNLTIRPIILPGKSLLRITVEGRSSEFLTTCDFRSRKVPYGNEIVVRQAESKLKTVMIKGLDFYSTLRNKLMWGADKRN
jgi:NAD+ kinase